MSPKCEIRKDYRHYYAELKNRIGHILIIKLQLENLILSCLLQTQNLTHYLIYLIAIYITI